ncbi:recombinase family protein [Paractinoplanes lichenicola]|uniref:recombinase family protein n=1 Tax=Paractinoplanes lichenicola TaxID=2802976 RepID=UPI001F1CC40C|nr:recombinase family protein [Actinoplanes lichenicola]
MSTPLTTHSPEPPDDLFTAWVDQTPGRARRRGRRPDQPQGALRFAFYGRMSTTEYQDPTTSQQWQQDNANRLIAGHGTIVIKYFDAGYSRSLPWHKRPAAANLLDLAAQPDRPFDAIVIGEYERAFTGQQAIQTIRHLNNLGVTVWLPEANGPIDLDEPAHQALLMMLGHQSEREVLKFRMRTTAAMCAQAHDQGRHLGGRPPYGYQLVDAGPHPNRAHAAWGRRLHRLDPDPDTAAHVRWIFARRLTGASTAGIARTLNDRRNPLTRPARPWP